MPALPVQVEAERELRASGIASVIDGTQVAEQIARLRDMVEQVRRRLMQVGQARSMISMMTIRPSNCTLGSCCES